MGQEHPCRPNPPLTRTTLGQLCTAPMAVPVTDGCRAWTQTRISSGTASAAMQCLRLLRHSGDPSFCSFCGTHRSVSDLQQRNRDREKAVCVWTWMQKQQVSSPYLGKTSVEGVDNGLSDTHNNRCVQQYSSFSPCLPQQWGDSCPTIHNSNEQCLHRHATLFSNSKVGSRLYVNCICSVEKEKG